MAILKSVALAFGMFSAVPVPRVEWSEKNLRYMLCAFPLVGAVIGGVTMGFFLLTAFFCRHADFLPRLLPLALVLIPIAVTGGIHLDGFMDTCDALASHADREKKLAILKDSHAGAFAVLGCVLYVLADFALATEFVRFLFADGEVVSIGLFLRAKGGAIVCFAAVFVQSRLLSAFSVATFPIAKDSGLVRTFSDASAKCVTAVWCAAWFVAISAVLVWFSRWNGVFSVGTMLIVLGGYFLMTRRHFGGISGDTAGWFVQMAELLCLFALIVTMEVV